MALKEDDFWGKIEGELKQNVPIYLKLVFELQELTNPEKLKRCSLDDIIALEFFVRSNEYRRSLPAVPNNTENIHQYYGGNKSPENFQFSNADRAMIKKILAIAKEKPTSFWQELTNIVECNAYQELRAYDKSSFLAILYRSFELNKNKKSQGYRYDKITKLICAFFCMQGGPLFYENFSANLPVPSIHTIRKFISSESVTVVEGCLRVNQLLKYLRDRHLPLEVFISEDATRITNRITYDYKTNQLVGFVLPLNANGMPVTYSFLATSADTMASHFRNQIASNLYTYMVQPPVVNAPSFCLMLFGTDNKFKSEDISARWKYMVNILNSNGIGVIGFGSDGDPKLVKTMKTFSKLSGQADAKNLKRQKVETKTFQSVGFRASLRPPQICIQDTVHIGNKLKFRILNESSLLPMGDYFASFGDIVAVVRKFNKDKHLLNESDLRQTDKMNFKATMRLCNPRIWNLLELHIPKSRGTQVYLRLMYYVTQSYLSTSLNLLERVYLIWNATYFYRMWRQWISLAKNKGYTIGDSFLTTNCYTCVELNAHALINLILRFLDHDNLDNLFVYQYGSQACESFYREFRSLCSTQSMIANCNVAEAINRIQKIQLQDEIATTDFEELGEKIVFPRNDSLIPSWDKQTTTEIPELPDFSDLFPLTENSLKKVMDSALLDAKKSITSLGMNAEQLDAYEITLDIVNASDSDLSEDDDVDDISDVNTSKNDNHSEDDLISFFDNLNEDLELKDYTNRFDATDPSSPTVIVVDPRNGEPRTVLKTTYTWLLANQATKLSSDRTVRVAQNISSKNPHGKPITTVELNFKKIFIADWCVFKVAQLENVKVPKENGTRKRKISNSKTIEVEKNRSEDNSCKQQYLLGRITNFCYLKQKGKSRRYLSRYADVEGNKRCIGVSGNWYRVEKDLRIIDVEMEAHGFVDIKNYIATIPEPEKREDNFFVTQNTYDYLESLII